MANVTVPEDERRLAFNGASLVAVLIDLFGVVVLLGVTLKLASPALSPGVHDALTGISAIASFAYAFVAHRGWVISVGGWCHDIRWYTYSQVEEYAGKGALYVYGSCKPKERVIRTVCAVIGLYLAAAIAGSQ